MPIKNLIPARIPILYLILGVLILVSVIPMYFYAVQVMDSNRERLKTNEMVLQNTITVSLAEDIDQRLANVQTVLGNLSTAMQVTSGGDLNDAHVNAPELRALLENFASSSNDIAYATLLNAQGKGISAGRITPDAFLQRQLERAYTAAQDGRRYNGDALPMGQGTVVLVSTPVMASGRFIGMLGAVVDLNFLIRRLQQVSTGGLVAYVVDTQGRLVAGATAKYASGQEMTKLEIVKTFMDSPKLAGVSATKEFTITEGRQKIAMLGSYRAVPSLEWAVVAQKPQKDAYQDVYEMQRTARLLAVAVVLLSVMISVFAARRITTPLEILTESSRAIARGDFSQRVQLKSRTEIGELAQTFNSMSGDLERLIKDLKRAAEENRALFLGSIQMLAGAVDEKDPYTRGHSDRVTRFSMMIATELGLSPEEIEVVRISAQLHDVGKIGIEDRILKKPGALTPEEYDVMKTHTSKGANILRPVAQLKEMIPGIELHHESLDGRGYPYGLKAEQIPLTPRIIMVADTFDAMTTNRPYQAAMEPDYAVKVINTLAKTKFDPKVVAALTAIFQRGELRMHRAAVVTSEQAAAAAVAQAAPVAVQT